MTNKNDFKPFATASGSNVISQADYELLAALGSGFTSGVAKSAELNKVWRQSSIIAAVIAQFMCETLNIDIVDDGDVEALKTKLVNALQQTYPTIQDATTTQKGIVQLLSDLASNASDETKAATSKGVNDLLNSKITAPLGAAAYRDVGTGPGEIPDMGSYQSSPTSFGYQKLPGGIIMQWGGGTYNFGDQVNYLIPFPSSVFRVFPTTTQDAGFQSTVSSSNETKSGFTVNGYRNSGGWTQASVVMNWFAIGI